VAEVEWLAAQLLPLAPLRAGRARPNRESGLRESFVILGPNCSGPPPESASIAWPPGSSGR
jgi:hypothetical protein